MKFKIIKFPQPWVLFIRLTDWFSIGFFIRFYIKQAYIIFTNQYNIFLFTYVG